MKILFDYKEIYSEVISKGFFICRNLIPLNEYKLVRDECLNFFETSSRRKTKLPKALRGNVGAGMKDNIGFTDNKKWKSPWKTRYSSPNNSFILTIIGEK